MSETEKEEITLETQLMEIATSKNISKESAKTLVDEFKAAVSLDDDFVEKAMAIVVTDESQTGLMEEADELRKTLQQQRIGIEKLRKSKKETYLRIGQAIDGVSKHVQGLIEPLETHLKKQADYAKLLEEAREIERREKAERLLAAEEEREAKEAAEAEVKRLALIEAENERLKVEAEKREKAAAAERKKAERARAAEQKKHAAAMAAERAERDEIERKGEEARQVAAEKRDRELAAERAEADARLREESDKRAEAQAKADRERVRERKAAEKRAAEDRAARDRALAAHEKELADARVETARLAALVKCPECGHTFDGREHPGE